SVAGVALVAWLATRRAFLNLATAAGSIPIRVRQMKYEDLEDFISELEQAKNNRFLLRTISFGCRERKEKQPVPLWRNTDDASGIRRTTEPDTFTARRQGAGLPPGESDG